MSSPGVHEARTSPSTESQAIIRSHWVIGNGMLVFGHGRNARAEWADLHGQATTIPSRPADDARQHARQRRAVARRVVLPMPPMIINADRWLDSRLDESVAASPSR